MRFSSPNSGSTSQNHFKIWQNDPPYKINRQVEEKLSNSVSGCRCDVIIDSKIANLVLKCASRVQTWDLLVRIISNFGNIIFHIKTANTYKNHKMRYLNVTTTSLLVLNGQFSSDMRCKSQTKVFKHQSLFKLTLNHTHIEDILL